MDTRAYLERVLPQTGNYAVLVIKQTTRKQQFFNDFSSLETAAKRFDAAGFNAYVAVNSFVDPAKGRKQDNVQACRSFYLDIDCGEGKPYADQREGAAALVRFVASHKLPQPLIISSGRGLHVYWVLDTDITPQEWKPVADALKQAAAADSFAIDMSVPGDSARVLRPIGTHNHKGEKSLPVRMLSDAPSTTLASMRASLIGQMAASRLGIITPPAPRSSTLLTNLAVTNEFPPANGNIIVSKCQQMEWITTNQAKVDEPLWYAMLGIAAHCEDSDNLAIEWSRQHPSFDQTKTLAKLAQWKQRTTGPTLCTKMEELRPGGCKGCKLKDKISSPCSLGLQYQAKQLDEEVAKLVHPNYMLPIPKPFKRTEQGVKITIDDTDAAVTNYDIFPVSYGLDEAAGIEIARYMWNRPNVGWSDLVLPSALLFDSAGADFAKAIGNAGLPPAGRKTTETVQYMLRSYMDDLRNATGVTNHYRSMGWKNDCTEFLVGTKLVKKVDDEVVVEDVATSKSIQLTAHDGFTQSGNLENWIALTKVMEKGKMYAHQFSLLVAFSSVFYEFSGLRGITMSLYGATGTGKTLAQYWQQSVWGNPHKLHYSAKFTPNALFAHMAKYNHLPVTVDEGTMISAVDIGDILYWMTQGRDKARLDRHAMERDPKTWATPLTISTNRSITSILTGAGLDTEAQQARLFELTMPNSKLFSANPDFGRKIFDIISTNHGWAGLEFLKELIHMGPGNIRQLVESSTKTFAGRYTSDFSGQERYWEQLVVFADLAGSIAKRLGLIQFDPQDSIVWVLEQMGQSRKFIKQNKGNCFDTITSYLLDSVGMTLTVLHTKGFDPVLDTSMPVRGEIRARFDVYRNTPQDKFDNGTLTIERNAFRTWLYDHGGDYKSFLSELAQANADVTPKSGKMVMGKNSPYRLGQTHVFAVDLLHAEMQNTLANVDTSVANTIKGELKVV